MANALLRIDELVLRVGGVTTADAERLAADVARALGDRLEARHQSSVRGALSARIEVPPHTPRARWAEVIADQLIAIIDGPEHAAEVRS